MGSIWTWARRGTAENKSYTGVHPGYRIETQELNPQHHGNQEMEHWRLGTRYDRPIPRRIAEEAGVARDMFGQVKLASVVDFPTSKIPITPELRAEFLRHLRKQGLLGRVAAMLLPVVQRLNNWICWGSPSLDNRRKPPLLWHVTYGWARIFGQPLRIREVWTQLDFFLYAICVNKIREEYATQLRPSGNVSGSK